MTRHTFYSFIVLLPEGIAAKKVVLFLFLLSIKNAACYVTKKPQTPLVLKTFKFWKT